MVLLALVVLAIPPSLAQETRIEVMAVRNRPAESLAQDLQRILGEAAVVTAASGRVIVNASPAVLARARDLLRELDTPARSLWISVRQDEVASGSYRAGGVSGQVTTGGVTAGVPATTETRRGNTVERTTTHTEVRGAFAQGNQQSSDATLQQVRATEGMPAFISVGSALPVTQAVVAPGPAGPTVSGGTSYVPVETGFYVTPLLAGDLVTLDLSATKERIRPEGVIDTRALQTTVSGRLGEWISLGEVLRSETARRSGLFAAAGLQSNEHASVLVRVDEIR
jgi:type II secretory pathway component GspD/PulD (secretin)